MRRQPTSTSHAVNGAPRCPAEKLAHEATWTRTCVFCDARMGPREWADLPLVKVLDRRELEPHLSVRVPWDIEVRRCACGALIASVGRH
jgi:hypothetical protein